MNLVYSKTNQTWFLMWNGQLLETFQTRLEAVVELKYRGLNVSKSGVVAAK